MADTTRLYGDLAPWWPLMSAPNEYDEEAAFAWQTLRDASATPPQTVLELGSGGGNIASHLKPHARLTLVDQSAGMLAVSQALNPECEHIQHDMRSLRLPGRIFDAVLVHDAINYMLSEDDLLQALETCFVHCRPGGYCLLMPDYVRESFRPATDHGGNDDEQGRGLRYLEWIFDPDPADTTYLADYAYLVREADLTTRVVHDRHTCGLFGRDDWLRLLGDVGFRATIIPDEWLRENFLAHKP